MSSEGQQPTHWKQLGSAVVLVIGVAGSLATLFQWLPQYLEGDPAPRRPAAKTPAHKRRYDDYQRLRLLRAEAKARLRRGYYGQVK